MSWGISSMSRVPDTLSTQRETTENWEFHHRFVIFLVPLITKQNRKYKGWWELNTHNKDLVKLGEVFYVSWAVTETSLRLLKTELSSTLHSQDEDRWCCGLACSLFLPGNLSANNAHHLPVLSHSHSFSPLFDLCDHKRTGGLGDQPQKGGRRVSCFQRQTQSSSTFGNWERRKCNSHKIPLFLISITISSFCQIWGYTLLFCRQQIFTVSPKKSCTKI